MEITRLVAPDGTAMEYRALDPVAPDRPVTATPFCSAVMVPPVVVAKAAPRLAELVPAAIVQLPVPVQAPLQPLNVLPLSGVAVKVTLLVVGKLPVAVEQDVPHEMPLGLLATVPLPVLVRVTVRVVALVVKLAETLCAAVMLTVQVLEDPEQAPPQLVKADPELAAAVSVTLVPLV